MVNLSVKNAKKHIINSEGSLSCDPQFWGHKHGKWSKSKSQEWLVSGDLQDTRDEDFIEEYPIEVAVVEVSDEEDPQEE